MREEKTFKGSYYGSSNPKVDFLTIVDHYRSGRLPLDKLVSKRYRLDQINEAFADMLSGSTLRGVVLFEQGSRRP